MTGRYDLKRSAVAFLAAVLASIAAYSAIGEPTLISGGLVAQVFAVEAIAAATLAAWPSGRTWSSRRRLAATGLAAVAVVSALPFSFFNLAIPGCACIGAEGYPELLGVGHRSWIWLALVSVPVLIGASVFWPSRHAEMPRAPGASTED